MSGGFTTKISTLSDILEEQKFQRWITALPWYSEFQQEYGRPPDLNTPDYDYRAAWRAGITPSRDPYDNNRYHWGSVNPQTGQELKATNHPTAWMEDYMRITGRDPRADSMAGGGKLNDQQIKTLSDLLRMRYGGPTR